MPCGVAPVTSGAPQAGGEEETRTRSAAAVGALMYTPLAHAEHALHLTKDAVRSLSD